MPICIVGSGLAAMAAAEALVEKGIRPIILDVGIQLDEGIEKLVRSMSFDEPLNWDANVKQQIFGDHILRSKGFPRKLAYGSDYFYGANEAEMPIKAETGEFPPFSYAKGGLSIGWGASALPADPEDLIGWPEESKNLDKFYRAVLNNKAYSAQDDGLSSNFPLYKSNLDPLKLQLGNLSLLRDMKNASIMIKDKVIFGQSRVLVRASNSETAAGCKYCGNCMNGCVYDSIYKSSQTLDRLLAEDKVEYSRNHKVIDFSEHEDGVEVRFKHKGQIGSRFFSKVFLAAGAVNTTRIVLKSKKLYGMNIALKSVPGFVVPMVRFKRERSSLPNANTLSGIFLEFKSEDVHKSWQHCQISVPNELVYKKYGVMDGPNNFYSSLMSRLLENIVIVAGTLHSDLGNGYQLILKEGDGEGGDLFISNRDEPYRSNLAIQGSIKSLSQISQKFGCHPIRHLSINNTVQNGYHVGGSLPMKKNPTSETETDILGRPLGFANVHAIDSSIFPSIPGTTIGLLAMANARRIIDQIYF